MGKPGTPPAVLPRGAFERGSVRIRLITLSCMDTPYQPKETGLDALDELDQVDWNRLQHAYGNGVVSLEGSNTSLGIAGDVARSLATLRDDPSFAIGDGLYSNVCHQGTVYEATAYAVPSSQQLPRAMSQTRSAYLCWRSWVTSRSEEAA